MELNIEANRESLIHEFPNLRFDKVFSVKSPQDMGYNCIAWAMGFDDRWVDYIDDGYPKKWWPAGIVRDWLPETLVKAFEVVGFESCGMDDSIEEGYDKVALYKVSPFFDQVSQTEKEVGWSHAARVVANGVYHSKIGASFDILHRSGDIFCGTGYGDIYQIMRRPVEKSSIVAEIKRVEPRFDISPDIMAKIARVMSGV